MPFHLLKHEDPNTGLRRVALEQIDIAINGFSDDSLSSDKKVHSLRARCKKLRGVLRLIRPMLGDEAYKEQDRLYRDAARELAGTRDRDVALKTLASLGVQSEVPETQQVSPDAVAHALEGLAACRAEVEAWPLTVIGFADLEPGFSRIYNSCLSAWSAVQLDPTDPNYHRLRKHAKYHWYHVRILERINKKKIRKRRHQLRDLQLMLGDAHDLFMLQAYLRGNEEHELRLYEEASARKHTLYSHGADLAAKIFAPSADKLAARYSRWWAESRGET